MNEQVICPKAKECKDCEKVYSEYRHDMPHTRKPSCKHGDCKCPACIPVSQSLPAQLEAIKKVLK